MAPPPDVRHTLTRGVSALEREDWAEALDCFNDVLERHPGFADVHNKAGICHAMLDASEEALAAFDAALSLNPAYAEAHLNRGIVLTELGRAEEARTAFQRARDLDTRDGAEFPSDVGHRIAEAHAHLGDLYMRAEAPVAAAREYRRALKVRPRFLDIRTKLAEALMEIEEPEAALDELEAILEQNPDFTAARLLLGVVYHRLGRKEDAIEAWRRCHLEAPRDTRPRAYLASVGVSADDVGESEDAEATEDAESGGRRAADG